MPPVGFPAGGFLYNEKPAACTVGFLARPARFERAAFRLGGERSILLSYGRIFIFGVPQSDTQGTSNILLH